MGALSHRQTFQMLLLQAADEGRRALLYGDSPARTTSLCGRFANRFVMPFGRITCL